MKTCFAFLAVLVVVAAKDHFPSAVTPIHDPCWTPPHDRCDDLIHKEVATIIQANPSLTVDQCTTKCDALFDLVDSFDEQLTDDMCMHACDCEVHNTCGDHSHTHPPHPTHPPHGNHHPA